VLKIVVDARSVVSKRSGIGNYVDALLRHMVPLAPDVEWLLLTHPSSTQPLVPHERVRQVPFRGETKSTSTVFGLGRAFRSSEYDLYHSPADLVPIGLACPYVVTIHDLMWIEAPRLASAFLPVRVANAAWYGVNIRRAVRGARRVICISDATADAVSRVFPASASKLCVARHGIELERYEAHHTPDRSALERWIPRGVRYSLIVGQGSPYKNHAGMVRAFVEATADDPKHRLVLLRRFSRIDLEMQRLLARPEVQAKVVSIEFVPDEVLLTLYREAVMLLFASHYEGFGLPALEAMAIGLPVLASTAPAVVEVTGEAALHADPTDHVDLTRKIRRLAQDAALRGELARRGLERAREFSWRRSAELHLAAYRAAIADQR
jgi:glycosyltransferase involved in cell wall biosynthesis